jgi:hypothetical protein
LLVDARPFSSPSLGIFLQSLYVQYRHLFSQTSGSLDNRDMGSFKLTILPLAERNRSAIGMASSLLDFLVWFGSANIASRLSSIRRIGSKAKSPASFSWTSSFVTVVTCKRGNSDCVPRKSVFDIDLPQKPQQPRKKGRHFGDEQQSDGNRGVEA